MNSYVLTAWGTVSDSTSPATTRYQHPTAQWFGNIGQQLGEIQLFMHTAKDSVGVGMLSASAKVQVVYQIINLLLLCATAATTEGKLMWQNDLIPKAKL